LGLGLKLVTQPQALQNDAKQLPADPAAESVAEAAAADSGETAAATAPVAKAVVKTFSPQSQGMGKGGNFWLAGYRSLSFAASILSPAAYESDDSIDVVIR
jgi:hypothetical protein